MITAESSVEIDRPVADVFSFVSDPTNEPKWHTDVLETSTPSQLTKGTEMRWVMNFMGRKELTMKVLDYEPNSREQLRAQSPLMGMQPTITYLFAQSGGGTKFTRQVEVDVKGPWRVMTPMMAAMVKKRNASFVKNLKETLQRPQV